MRYTLRAVKYFIRLSILLAFIFMLMVVSGTAGFSTDDFFTEFFSSRRGMVFSVVMVLWCVIYPKVEYVSREIDGVRIDGDRPRIIAAFEAAGFRLESRSDTRLVFRAASLFRRVLLLWEDAVTVSAAGRGVVVEGSRKAVAETGFRIKLYTEQDNA